MYAYCISFILYIVIFDKNINMLLLWVNNINTLLFWVKEYKYVAINSKM